MNNSSRTKRNRNSIPLDDLDPALIADVAAVVAMLRDGEVYFFRDGSFRAAICWLAERGRIIGERSADGVEIQLLPPAGWGCA